MNINFPDRITSECFHSRTNYFTKVSLAASQSQELVGVGLKVSNGSFGIEKLPVSPPTPALPAGVARGAELGELELTKGGPKTDCGFEMRFFSPAAIERVVLDDHGLACRRKAALKVRSVVSVSFPSKAVAAGRVLIFSPKST